MTSSYKPIWRRAALVLAAAVAIAIVSYFYLISSWRPEVVFLDVGQGDAILIKTPDKQVILIDGGPDNRVLRRLGENLPFYRRRIDLVIYSHYHDDHTIGLVEVVERYQVGKLLYADGGFNSNILKTLREAAGEREIPLVEILAEATIALGPDCSLNLLNPAALGVAREANNSVVAFLDCAGQRFLFSGDNDAQVEKALLASGRDLRADVMKASHHGSKTANTAAFLSAVAPRFFVIPVGLDNKFGHPHQEILDLVGEMEITIKRTDQERSIHISIPQASRPD